MRLKILVEDVEFENFVEEAILYVDGCIPIDEDVDLYNQ